MIDTKKLFDALEKAVTLLRSANEIEWAAALETSQNELSKNTKASVDTILGMFGGMGSLNDVVLYNEGVPLSEANNQLDALRHEIYQLCQAKHK
jgi:hypothetical protein